MSAAPPSLSGCCDLHMHSSRSDGTDTPTALVEKAARLGLAAIAVTDHDTTEALEEAREAGQRHGVKVLSGVEISADHAGRTVHLLAYCFDAGVDRLRAGLEEMRVDREARNHQIIAKLQSLGLDITYDDVVAEAGSVVGRPHFASVLLKRKVVGSLPEAFSKYLATGGAAYVERRRFPLAEAVAMARAAHGVPVLAHPKLTPLGDGESMEGLVASLAKAGLMGLECYYSMHAPEDTAAFLGLAERYDLIVTGGSDYHGANKPHIEMGAGKGDLRVPLSCVESLEARAAQATPAP